MPAFAPDRRNVLLLAASQGMFQTTSVLIMTIGGLAGYLLAADKALATLPISAMSIGTAIATIPASLLMARIGRRGGFILGTILGVAGGALGVGGLRSVRFGCSASPICSWAPIRALRSSTALPRRMRRAPNSAAGRFRWCWPGGVFAAFAGPALANVTTGLSLSAALRCLLRRDHRCYAPRDTIVSLIRVPPPQAETINEPARPLAVIARQPVFLVALGGAAVGYGVMIMAMTATPLAMVGHHHDLGATSSVIRWHTLGHVRAVLLHRRPDRAVWRAAHHARRHRSSGRSCRHRLERRRAAAFHIGARAARGWLEFFLYRRHGAADGGLPAVGKGQGPSDQ